MKYRLRHRKRGYDNHMAREKLQTAFFSMQQGMITGFSSRKVKTYGAYGKKR